MEYTLKKSLGQHFLKDESIAIAIKREVERGISETASKHLLEVGPGAGALTAHLLEIGQVDFKAVEFDHEKVVYLQKHFADLKRKVIEADFLNMEFPFPDEAVVCGNFPYNISTQIVFKILDWKDKVPFAVGMFQKEVAERIASSEGSKVYGILSVLTQAFYEVEYLFDVPAEAFNPPPKVVSGVLKMKRKTTSVSMRSESDFFKIVKQAFNQRRKMLRNSLKGLFDPEMLQQEIFTKRPEQLSVEVFASLTYKMQ